MGVDKQLNSCQRGAREVRPVPGGFNAMSRVVPELSPTTGGWIPVSERLPPRSGDYLVLMRNQRYRVMDYALQGETFFPRGLNLAVTHWRELPPVPA